MLGVRSPVLGALCFLSGPLHPVWSSCIWKIRYAKLCARCMAHAMCPLSSGWCLLPSTWCTMPCTRCPVTGTNDFVHCALCPAPCKHALSRKAHEATSPWDIEPTNPRPDEIGSYKSSAHIMYGNHNEHNEHYNDLGRGDVSCVINAISIGSSIWVRC